MKRQLDKKERELVERGLKRAKQDLDVSECQLAFVKAQIEKRMYLREWEDKWKPVQRKLLDYGDTEKLKELEKQLKQIEIQVRIDETQLKEGVEVKTPKMVK